MEDNRNWKIFRNNFIQRIYESWLILVGRHSLHRAWQLGLDLGHSQEYERIIVNMGEIAAQEKNVEKAKINIAKFNPAQ